MTLAIPGVVLTTILVGLVVAEVMGLSLATAMAFGAIVAATDPVAVVSLFRALGAPKQLSMMVEGESLFNDGTAIVVYKLVIVAALPAGVAASAAGESLNIFQAVVGFLKVSAGGILIGVATGWLTSKVISYFDDYLIETTLTTVVAFGSCLVAEKLDVSGVLAVVSAGIVCGNVGPRGMSPTTRIMLFNFWEYLAFIVNSFVFLLIGLDVKISQITGTLGPIGIAILAVILSRVTVVYGLTWLTNLASRTIPLKFQHVLVWGGLRGAIFMKYVRDQGLRCPALEKQNDVGGLWAWLPASQDIQNRRQEYGVSGGRSMDRHSPTSIVTTSCPERGAHGGRRAAVGHRLPGEPGLPGST